MRVDNQKLICILLVIVVSITGMCFEDSRTHSSFAYEQADFCDNIRVLDFTIGAEQFCTTRMLYGQNEESLQQLFNYSLGEESDLKLSLDDLCINIFSLEPGKFSSSSAVVSFNNVYAEELISIYVHKADGKK